MRRSVYRGDKSALMAKCMKAKILLERAGWKYNGCIMHSDNDTNYGTIYVKDGATFYLNHQTVDALPDGVA